MALERVICDVGANNGDDIPDYLMKGDVVVAIEANPVLCEGIRERFPAEIRAGRVILEPCVVTAVRAPDEVDFYLHKSDHVLSQLPTPPEAVLDQYAHRRLSSKPILDIIRSHGAPYYIKIDIEHYDAALLRALFEGGIRPPFISAECHTIEVFLLLLEQGGYRAFKLVDGDSVSRVYADRSITSERTRQVVPYSFPYHSAGPFGNDVDGKWMAPGHFMRLLAFEGFGWKDIHATTTEDPDPTAEPRAIDHLDRLVKLHELLPYVAWRIGRSVSSRVARFFTGRAGRSG